MNMNVAPVMTAPLGPPSCHDALQSLRAPVMPHSYGPFIVCALSGAFGDMPNCEGYFECKLQVIILFHQLNKLFKLICTFRVKSDRKPV